MKKVYIIDDDAQIGETLSQFVSMLGFEVVSYTSAVEFFVKYPDEEHDITIMLDLNMPDMDGIEVIRRLAERGSHASLILISGYDTSVLHSAEKLAHAHNLKTISSLTKPISFSQLESIFDEIGRSEIPQFIERGEVHLPLRLSEFRDALVAHQLILHYQPQVGFTTGALVGVEALVRWQHPQCGLIFPNHIIPMAQEFGLMEDLTA